MDGMNENALYHNQYSSNTSGRLSPPFSTLLFSHINTGGSILAFDPRRFDFKPALGFMILVEVNVK